MTNTYVRDYRHQFISSHRQILPFNKGYDRELIPVSPKKFSNQIDNNFCVPQKKKLLNDDVYRNQKEEYLKTGDAKIIIYAYNNIDNNPIVITEETPHSNDGKLFHKIPVICDILNIPHTTIAEWLSSYGVRLDWIPPVPVASAFLTKC